MMDQRIHEVTLGISGKTVTTAHHGLPPLFLLIVNQHLQKFPEPILFQVKLDHFLMPGTGCFLHQL